MPKKIIAWVLKTHQKEMMELYPHWDMEFVDSAEELVSRHGGFDAVVVSLTKVRTYKTVNALKQIEKILFLGVEKEVTSTMFRALDNTEHDVSRVSWLGEEII